MDEIVLAVDLGGTNLRAAAVRPDGAIAARCRAQTPRTGDPRGIVAAVLESGRSCLSQISAKTPAAVALAVPAAVGYESGRVLKAPNLPCLDGFDIRSSLENVFGTPVFLENDANAAALGENWKGASRGMSDSIMVTLGTGMGGGIIVRGSVLRGADGTAGEIGHICIEPDGLPCGCGSKGCVEQYVSALAIVRMAGEQTDFSCVGYPSARSVFDAAKEGDPRAAEVFRRMGVSLGIALADLINIFNPEAIVIGGGVSGAWDLFIGHTVGEIRARAFKEPAERARLLRPLLGDDAGVLGAARAGFDGLGGNF